MMIVSCARAPPVVLRIKDDHEQRGAPWKLLLYDYDHLLFLLLVVTPRGAPFYVTLQLFSSIANELLRLVHSFRSRSFASFPFGGITTSDRDTQKTRTEIAHARRFQWRLSISLSLSVSLSVSSFIDFRIYFCLMSRSACVCRGLRRRICGRRSRKRSSSGFDCSGGCEHAMPLAPVCTHCLIKSVPKNRWSVGEV